MPSACSRRPPSGSGLERSKTPMLSRPRKPPAKRLLALSVLAVHPPGEIDQQLLEARGPGRCRSRWPRAAGHLVDAPAGPGVDRRVDVAEGELVGRQLPVGVHVPLAQEAGRAAPWRNAGSISANGIMWKAEVPGGVPGVLPLVGHRDHVAVDRGAASRGCGRAGGSAGGGGWSGSPSSQSLTT